MNIIVEGNKNWELHVTNYCKNCGCSYQLEEGDKYEVKDSMLESTIRVFSRCPACDHYVKTENPHCRPNATWAKAAQQ